MNRDSRVYWMMRDPVNRERIKKVVQVVRSLWKLNAGVNTCYRWVEDAARRIKGLGPSYWDNADYVIDMVEFRFTPRGGWDAHAMLRVTVKGTGQVFFFDDGVCGDSGPWILLWPRLHGGIAFDVPTDWTIGDQNSLDDPWPDHSPMPELPW